MTAASLASLDRDLVRRGGLYDFVQVAWSQVEPATRFIPGWHLEVICQHLEAVSRCEIRRLIINEPPGCCKSLITSVFWPAWEWIERPATRWIHGSFDLSLPGARDGGRLIRLLQSPWWLARWPAVLPPGKLSTNRFDTLAGGSRFATSPGSKGTGRHANIVVIDDPIKPADTLGGSAVTHVKLDTVSQWYRGTLATRQADPTTHREVIVMQRLHKDDLAGELSREPGTTVLRLPMRYEVSYPSPGDPRTQEGELLWPARYPEDTVKLLEKNLTEYHAAAQLQQRPHVRGGQFFRRSRWRFYGPGDEPCLCDECFDRCVADPTYRNPEHKTGRPCVALPGGGFEVLSADFAFKGTQHSDFVAITAWRAAGGRFFVLDLLNERLDFADSKTALLRMAIAHSDATVLVEDAANGPAIQSELSNDLAIELVRPEGGKEARVNACLPLFASESVYLPADAPWIWALMSQCEAFPADVHDDQVDSLTQALVWYRANGYSTLFEAAMATVREMTR